jgi:RNA polymerase sigma-70 factor (ECF subfamily)
LSGDSADDLIQGFVADTVIEQNLLGRAEQGRGRFRSFLLAAIDHYVVGQFRRERAQKRRPARAMLDIADQPNVSSADAEPSWQFTLVWAREVVEEAKRRTEAHCKEVDRPDLWLVFTERVVRPAAENTVPPPHERIAGDLNLGGSKAAANLLVTSKRLFARMLRVVVAEYVADEREIDEEIEDLMRALARHG